MRGAKIGFQLASKLFLVSSWLRVECWGVVSALLSHNPGFAKYLAVPLKDLKMHAAAEFARMAKKPMLSPGLGHLTLALHLTWIASPS